MAVNDLYKQKDKCAGCSACMNICPRQAITMEADEYGFIYPKVNEKKCVNCDLCKKVCAYQNDKLCNNPIKTYASICRDKNVIMKSSSGGVFASIAKNVLENDGIIYGCAMELVDGVETPKHIRVNNISYLEKLQGSKYVKSIIGYCYQDVKKDLKNDRIVLFSGTPCQVDALKKYLTIQNINIEKLYTIDIICHGTPSTKFFQDYVKYLEMKYKKRITNFIFRDKKNNWSLRGLITYKKNNKEEKKVLYSNYSSYYEFFLKSKVYRENCYSCKYACKNRVGDITIGDYWGIQEKHPEYLKQNGGELDSELGISCVIINSIKGENIIKEYGKNLIMKESTFENASQYNHQLREPSKLSEERKKILDLYKNYGYIGVEKYYKKNIGIKRKIKILYYELKRKIKHSGLEGKNDKR